MFEKMSMLTQQAIEGYATVSAKLGEHSTILKNIQDKSDAPPKKKPEKENRLGYNSRATKNADTTHNTGGPDMIKDRLFGLNIYIYEMFLSFFFLCAPLIHVKIIVSNSISIHVSSR